MPKRCSLGNSNMPRRVSTMDYISPGSVTKWNQVRSSALESVLRAGASVDICLHSMRMNFKSQKSSPIARPANVPRLSLSREDLKSLDYGTCLVGKGLTLTHIGQAVFVSTRMWSTQLWDLTSVSVAAKTSSLISAVSAVTKSLKIMKLSMRQKKRESKRVRVSERCTCH